MKLRVLSIDRNLDHDAITNANFFNAPAFSDFDAVIINPTNIQARLLERPASTDNSGNLITYTHRDGGNGHRLLGFMVRRLSETYSLLSKTKGVVLATACPVEVTLQLWDSFQKTGQITHYDWLPCMRTGTVSKIVGSAIELFPRTGTIVQNLSRNHPLVQYFTAFQDEMFYSCVISLTGQNPIPEIIATDKVGKPICVDFHIEGGRVVFLPSLDARDKKKEGGILVNVIRQLLGRAIHEEGPEWISEYQVYGLGAFKGKIEELDTRVRGLEKEKSELEAKEMGLRDFQNLLYGQGKYVLEPAVREAFRVLGFDVPNPEDYEEPHDLRLASSEGTAIGEVEGVDTGPVDVVKYRQLLDYVDEELTKSGIEYKGILLGNGYRLTNPKDRPDQFTESARRGCVGRGFCMIATTDLFQAVNAVLKNPNDESLKERIRRDILGSVGDWKFVM
ncbi:MAG: hypothetical protein ACYSTI_12850 [Planctomycetota bacterium]|jgi:hypothetical protein